MKKAHIFVANDDKSFLGLMQDLLESPEYTVSTLRVGHSAYDQIKKALPDLLILDIVIEHPDSGWRTLDMIKLDPETAHIPVIVCSSDHRALREKQAHLESLGCLIVEKPFDLDTLLDTVKQALA